VAKHASLYALGTANVYSTDVRGLATVNKAHLDSHCSQLYLSIAPDLFRQRLWCKRDLAAAQLDLAPASRSSAPIEQLQPGWFWLAAPRGDVPECLVLHRNLHCQSQLTWAAERLQPRYSHFRMQIRSAATQHCTQASCHLGPHHLPGSLSS